MDKRPVLTFLGIFAIWRVVLFAIGAWLAPWLSYQPSFPYAYDLLPLYGLPQWLYSWANFDGIHYLTIAEKGYIGTGLIQAFFPGFPFLMIAFNWLTANSLVSGLLVANLSLMAVLPLWFFLVKHDYGKDAAKMSLALWLLFPTAFFLGAVYSESLFMVLVLGSFLAARTQRWWLAGILVALASATRVVGVLLVPALLLELLLQESALEKGRITLAKLKTGIWSVVSKKKSAVLWILAGMVGLIAYMIFLNGEFHDPLYFLHVQSEFGAGRQETLVTYPQVVWRYFKILVTYRPFDLKYYAFVQEAVVGVLGLVCLLWSVRSVRWSYALFALGAFLVPTVTGTFSSVPRYYLVCFPFFIWLALRMKTRRWLMWSYLLVSSLLLILNTVLFIQGYWVA